VGVGLTVLGVPDGVADPVGDDDVVPDADDVSVGLADVVEDGVAVGDSPVGLTEADVLGVPAGAVDVVELAPPDAPEQAASTNGRTATVSAAAEPRDRIREGAGAVRVVLEGMSSPASTVSRSLDPTARRWRCAVRHVCVASRAPALRAWLLARVLLVSAGAVRAR
jgi:hypothetical protein